MTSSSISKLEGGQSLIAMVFVILFIAAMSGVVMTSMLPIFQNSNLRDTNTKAKQIRDAISAYIKTHGTTLAGPVAHPPDIDALFNDDASGPCAMDGVSASPTYKLVQGWCGPYLIQFYDSSELTVDGWGSTWNYDQATSNFTSYGPNRTFGDGDDIVYTP